MYSKRIDVYTFDITETRHIHWMVYVITQNHFEDLVKLLEGEREGNTSTWKYFGGNDQNMELS